MALNQEFVGKVYPDTDPYLIGREKIREFATAIGDFTPIFHDLAVAHQMGYRDLPAPPTFAFVIATKALASTMFDPGLGLDYSRVVHGEQGFTYREPLQAGDEVVVRARIVDIGVRGANELLFTEADIVTLQGDLLVTTNSTIVVRGTA